ncbi:MAG: hypothetical protein ACE5EQ_11445 [Phycisphaerae bacterium]
MGRKATSCVVSLCTFVLVLGGVFTTSLADVDISVSRIGLNSSGSGDDFHYYGLVGDIRGFAIASTSCNVGTLQADWISGNSGNHPLIARNMYRLLNNRFEQIGMSWVKHSFCAVSEPTCGTCSPTGCGTLGIGCADTYWATLNGDQGGLGPRTQINPQGFGSGATHTDPHPSPTGNVTIRGRLQIHDADILAGGQNFAEIQYVTHDEPSGNRQNNASWREVLLGQTSITGMVANEGQASVHFQEAAIFAWQREDPTVFISQAIVPNGGHFFLGAKVTDLMNGTWQYEYALYNMNSDRGAQSFSVPIQLGVNVTNIGFHDVDYHSGDGVGGVTRSGVDWTASTGGGLLTWSTEPFAANENANALMWGTLYNFRFVANAPPTPDANSGLVTIGLFKPGSGTTTVARTFLPTAAVVSQCDSAVFTPGDINNDTFVNGIDIDRFTEILVAGGGTTEENCAGDLEAVPDDMIDIDDVPNFVSCVLAGGCP